jgi:hypothetical protein
MVQLDSIRVDVEATLDKATQLCCQRRQLAGQEAAFLASIGVSLVVVDIPGLPVEAATLAGIPSVAVGNFGWDCFSVLVRNAR